MDDVEPRGRRRLRRLLIDHGCIGRTFFRGNPAEQEPLAVAADQHDAIIARHDPATAARIVRDHLDLSPRNMAAYATPEGMDLPVGA